MPALLLLLLLGAPDARWRATTGEVTYVVAHPFKEVVGKSQKAEAMAVREGGTLKIMARVPVQSFDSGDGNRDAHVMEVIEAARYSHAVVRAVWPGFTPPAPGTTLSITLPVELELRGTKHKSTCELVVKADEAARLSVTAKLHSSLTAHGIPLPSLMFVPVEDTLRLQAAFSLEAVP